MLYKILFLCFFFQSNSQQCGPIELYLDLVKKSLINSIYQDASLKPVSLQVLAYQQKERECGLDWPSNAHTMIGLKRLDNIQYCAEEIIKNKVAGDFIETGVWRGGATILMRAILKAYDDTTRKVWVADSFQGLPKPNAAQYPVDRGDNHHTHAFLSVSLEQVKSNFEKYGLLDEQVEFVKGWFSETLPTISVEKLALLRLDGDMYESTIVALENLYPKLSVGGFVLVDDYALGGARKAVEDFRAKYDITDEIKVVDWTGVYWKKTK